MKVLFKHEKQKGWIVVKSTNVKSVYLGFGKWSKGKDKKPFYFPTVHHASTTCKANGYQYGGIVIEFKGLEIREGNEAWGAEKGVEYFVLKTGNIISRNNC